MEKPKVFIVVNAGHDYNKANVRGDLVYLYDDKVNVFASDKLLRELETKLTSATADDYLVPSGNSLATCLAFTVLLAKTGQVNVLIYSFKNDEYEVRTIRRGQFATKLEV